MAMGTDDGERDTPDCARGGRGEQSRRPSPQRRSQMPQASSQGSERPAVRARPMADALWWRMEGRVEVVVVGALTKAWLPPPPFARWVGPTTAEQAQPGYDV